MSAKVRVGVIGCGWWATRAHLPALTSHPDAQVVAVADPDDGNRSRAAKRFHVRRQFPDAEAMLAEVEMDAAVVATPHVTHAPLARLCLERGLDLLIEKPMTLDPADARDLLRLARSAGRHVVVGYPWHYNRQGLALRSAIADGRIGRIEAVSVLFASMARELYRGRPEPYREALGYPVNAPGERTYSDPVISGGGQGQTQVTHAAALLLWLTGLHPERVAAMTADFELPVDLADAVTIGFEGGAIGTLASTGSVLPGQDEQLELRLYGTHGHVRWDVLEGRATLHGGKGQVRHLGSLPSEDRYPEDAPARNLVGVVRGTEANGSPGQVGALAVAFVEAMYRSARSGRLETPASVDPGAEGANP